MDSPQSIPRVAYELPLPQELSSEGPIEDAERPLPESILVQNAVWFCRFRWLVIATLVGYGLVGLTPGLLGRFGLRSPGKWPFAIAGLLVSANLTYLMMAKRRTSSARIMSNLWSQIIVDLAVLTAVIYFVGSLDTNRPGLRLLLPPPESDRDYSGDWHVCRLYRRRIWPQDTAADECLFRIGLRTEHTDCTDDLVDKLLSHNRDMGGCVVSGLAPFFHG